MPEEKENENVAVEQAPDEDAASVDGSAAEDNAPAATVEEALPESADVSASIGRKVGMTNVFDEFGTMIPVTVLEVGPCVVLQRKSTSADGYDAVQLGYLDQKESRMPRPAIGHCKKAGTAPKRFVREVRVDADSAVKSGDTVTVRTFEDVGYVDVIATTKGRGFQGVVKRHNMAGGRMSHGGHSKRRPGAIGCSSYPANVSKGKAMPGHMGNRSITVQNLAVVQVRGADNLLLVRGAVPGPNGGVVFVRRALKKKAKATS
ncbi:MAG: 50S ribosomal protein L3 [Verrucomicrobia bacterium]|nr:50S ribosomal protein L3 [Verrucomicrobiota bacterium]MDA1085747.1 50S ribosomal protein L3 [Verrucomicrobiota bacterium]